MAPDPPEDLALDCHQRVVTGCRHGVQVLPLKTGWFSKVMNFKMDSCAHLEQVV